MGDEQTGNCETNLQAPVPSALFPVFSLSCPRAITQADFLRITHMKAQKYTQHKFIQTKSSLRLRIGY